MKTFILTALLMTSFELSAQDFPAPGYRDTTVQALNKISGLELLEERLIADINVKLHLSDSAKQAIAKQAFKVPDPQFDQAKFNEFILKSFESSLAYFREVSPGDEIKELNLVIEDHGGDKGTISEVTQHSRVVHLHLVRWHQYYMKKSEHYVAVSSIHEFAHIINYMYSPKETKLHREMIGVFVEGINFLRLYGIDSYKKAYSYYYTSEVKDLEQIVSTSYTNMNVIRHIVFQLFTGIYDGKYTSTLAPKELTETLAIAYMKESLDDLEGLNKVFEDFELKDNNGNILTFEKLQADTKFKLEN